MNSASMPGRITASGVRLTKESILGPKKEKSLRNGTRRRGSAASRTDTGRDNWLIFSPTLIDYYWVARTLFRSSSMASDLSIGAYLLMGLPCRSIRNLVKFHLIPSRYDCSYETFFQIPIPSLKRPLFSDRFNKICLSILFTEQILNPIRLIYKRTIYFVFLNHRHFLKQEKWTFYRYGA